MKFITRSFSTFHSFYMLMFYILMNSSYKINLAKASITAAGIENNGKFSINQCTKETGRHAFFFSPFFVIRYFIRVGETHWH